MNKLRVGVLMGGKSIEKEVSFNSGRTICDHLDTSRYEIIPLFQKDTGELYILPWNFLHRGKISDFEHRLSTQAQAITWDDLKQTVDFIYIALHGRFAEDGTLQGMLEVLGIPYLGSKVFSSALGMDKVIQKDFLRMHGIEVPKDVVVYPHELEQYRASIETLVERIHKAGFNFPCIVKPHKEGSSLGMSVVHSASDLYATVHTAAHIYKNTQQAVLIEEKIKGMEFTCITLTDYTTGKPLYMPPTEVVHEAGSEFYDYEQKYMPGRAAKFTPARCRQEHIKKIQDTCAKVMQVLEMENMSRTDGFLTDDGRVIIIDPNTLTGMAPSSFLFRQAAEINMSHTHLINHLIATELQQYGMLASILAQEQQQQKTMEQKIRIAVFLGGASNEKEISLESGRNIVYKLSPQKYDIIPVFVSSSLDLYKINQRLLVHNSTKEIEHDLEPSMHIKWSDLKNVADFVFLGLHGGAGENGCIQGALEMLGIPYNGSSVFASALCMDKYKTNQFLKAKGFDVPQGKLIRKDEWLLNPEAMLASLSQDIPFPMIVKPHDDGCSVLVQKAKTTIELTETLTKLFEQKKYALVEECIVGMELTVGVIGNNNPQALPPSQAIATKGVLSIEEKFLPGAGENQTPAPLSAATLELIQRTMEHVYKTIGCKGYSRIDCFYQSPEQSPTGKERVVILEINSLPGMTPATVIFHQAAELGIKPMDFVDMIVQLGLEEHAHNKLATHEQVTEETILQKITSNTAMEL